MVMVGLQFVMEDPEGHGEEKETEQGTEAMEKLLFHRTPQMLISDGQTCPAFENKNFRKRLAAHFKPSLPSSVSSYSR